MTYVISDACVDIKDKSCVRECPVDCIYEGERAMYIHPDECIDCGACEATCPVEAILFDVDLEDSERHLLERTSAFIAETGAGGGARSFGPLGRDHPAIAALPTQSA